MREFPGCRNDSPLEPDCVAPYGRAMEQERAEVYERIPWETLEKQGPDRQWLVMGVAGAIAVGALAFTFVRSQPPPAPVAVVASTAPLAIEGTPQGAVAVPSVQPTVTSPLAVAEADLYAVEPSALAEAAANHAEWFAVEYMAFDGSDQSSSTLASLLPQGIPLPEAVGEAQVFVDWVGVRSVAETAPAQYSVEVVVRSLAALSDGPFVRQSPRLLVVEVGIGPDGSPQVLLPPSVSGVSEFTPAVAQISSVPDEIRAQVESAHGAVVGGVPLQDGRWKVVAVASGPDGVSRPVTVVVP